MKKQVTVGLHPETKAIWTINENKPDYSTMRVDQGIITMENGFLNKSKRSDFITVKTEFIKELGYTANTTFPGQIVRLESSEPQFEGQLPKINPTTKEEVLVNGKNVYFQDIYTEDLTTKDILLKSSLVSGVLAENGAVSGIE